MLLRAPRVRGGFTRTAAIDWPVLVLEMMALTALCGHLKLPPLPLDGHLYENEIAPFRPPACLT